MVRATLASVLMIVAGSAVGGSARQPGEPSPLAGPKVRERVGGPRFGLGGELRRPTIRPEETVLRTLDLDAGARASVDRIFNARGRTLVAFITGNIDLLNRLNVSGSAGDKLGTAALLAQALGRLEAMGFRGDVTAEVRAALPDPHRPAFDLGMAEFWSAVAMEKVGKPREMLRRGDVYAARLEESGKILGQELEAAFQRAERSGEFITAYLLEGLGLSEHQRERIRAMVFAKLDMTGAELPEAERNALFVGILAYLTPEQQERLMRKVRGN